MKKALLIINVTSGKALLSKRLADLIEFFMQCGYEIRVHIINPEKGLTLKQLKKEEVKEYDLVVLGGGDGTLNSFINYLMEIDERPVIGYLPSGSTNDFAKSIGIPADLNKACNVIRKGELFTYDIGSFNDKYFNYVAAFGAFAEVSFATDQNMKNAIGYAAYVLNAIKDIPQSIGYSKHLHIETDTKTIEGDYVFGAVSNSVSVGGLKLYGNTPVGLDDGKLELLLIKTPQVVTDFSYILNAISTGDLNNEFVSLIQIKYANISSEEEITWSIDGEFGGKCRETKIGIVEKAITIKSGLKAVRKNN
ncbi:MAG: YegS/Rv2252/BmrU family lipid kinase [Lachnospiraceae bacterium]|nr:YegS/Rv2252/BmrU family lipid kinase [Lachnospiraceae bacterium]